MFEHILHKFYAATISVGLDGSMLVASNKDRLMVWGMIFCFISAFSLIALLLWRKPYVRKLALSTLIISLVIPVFVMPSARKEFIHVSRDQITIDTGYW